MGKFEEFPRLVQRDVHPVEKGREEGLKEGIEKVLKKVLSKVVRKNASRMQKMKQAGIAFDVIAQVTGLSIGEIASL